MDDAQLIADAMGAGVAWYGVAAACVTVCIRLLRRPVVQRLLPHAVRWASLPAPAQWAIVGLTAAGASWVTSLIAGHPPGAAALAALPVALAAVGGHEGTRACGYLDTRRRIKRAADYRPGSIRTTLDVVLPIDHRALRDRDRDMDRGRPARG
jgi:hypothetical protein